MSWVWGPVMLMSRQCEFCRECVRVLIPYANVVDSGFHDVTLLDMADASGLLYPRGTCVSCDGTGLFRYCPVLYVPEANKTGTVASCVQTALLWCTDWVFPVLWHKHKTWYARHVSSFHLGLAQLWRCPVSWCTQWKGTPHDCIDHIRKKHSVPDSVKAANLGRWFPPWTVTRAAWHKALKPQVSGISMDVVLLSENSSQLVHHYRVLGRSVAHASLRRTFMANLPFGPALMPSGWPNMFWSTSSGSPAPLPRSIRPWGSGDESPSCKAPQAVAPGCRLELRRQRSSRQPCHMPGQLRPMTRRCRSRILFFMVGGRQYCVNTSSSGQIQITFNGVFNKSNHSNRSTKHREWINPNENALKPEFYNWQICKYIWSSQWFA